MSKHKYGKNDFYQLVEPKTVDELFTMLMDENDSAIFRGQSDASWGFETSLERTIKRTGDTQVDMFQYISNNFITNHTFSKNMHLFSNESDHYTDYWDRLAFMQHYGFPTPLLDFSKSPFIALYFALDVNGSATNETSALFVVEINAIVALSKGSVKLDYKEEVGREPDEELDYMEFARERGKPYLFCKEPDKSNIRILNQQGCFVLSTAYLPNMVDSFNVYGNKLVKKYEFPSKWRFEIHQRLEKMNITSTVLFPSTEGVVEGLKRDFLLSSK